MYKFILCSVSIRAYNRYQPIRDGSYITICAYSMFLRLIYTHAHTLYYIILGMLIAYRTKLLSPLSSNTRTSASWLTIPLFIFRLFPGLRICTTLSPWQAVSICHISLCHSDTANIQHFRLGCIFR